jgi:hypothetical protein
VKIVVCECGARSTTGGDCIKCGEPLGSIPSAIAAAFVAALALTLVWVTFFWLTGVVLSWFAVLFGGLVSGAVAHASFGRGWAYQAIASTATLVGLTAAQVLIVLIVNDRLRLLTAGIDGWVETSALAIHLLENDTWLLIFNTFGLVGGFWLWHQPEAE